MEYLLIVLLLMGSAFFSGTEIAYTSLSKLKIKKEGEPATRTEREDTIPPKEITATSVVPPPISTTILPVGSPTGSPAPMAAASGSSMIRTSFAPVS